MRLKDVEKRGKTLLRKAFHLIPRKRSTSLEILSKRRIERILVIRLDNRLGNLLLITPFLGRLRGCFPGARIDLLVSRAFAEVLEENPDIDSLIVADKAGFIRRPWRFIRFIRDMRGSRYDLCVDLSSSHTFSVTSGCAVRLSGAPLRLGFRRGESDRFLNILVDPPGRPMHEAAIHVNLLEGLPPGGSSPGNQPGSRDPDEAMERVAPGSLSAGAEELRLHYHIRENEILGGKTLAEELGLTGAPTVALFIGARGEKAWGDENFLEVARELSKGFQVLILAGKSEEERFEGIRHRIEGSNIHIAPLLPIREFAGLVRQCSLFISGDCGPMHLASALGVRVLAIFNVDNYVKYGPLGEGNRVLYGSDEKAPSHVAIAAMEMLSEISRSIKPDRKGAAT